LKGASLREGRPFLFVPNLYAAALLQHGRNIGEVADTKWFFNKLLKKL
jgi:hypothetical protein